MDEATSTDDQCTAAGNGRAPVDVDLLIVGAGPSGLYAAYYAGFRGMSVAVMDSLPELGGQVTALYPEKLIYDVAGFPEIKGQAMVDALVAQAASAEPAYLLGHRAETLVTRDDNVEVTTHRDLVVRAKAVLITGGIGTFTPDRCRTARSTSSAAWCTSSRIWTTWPVWTSSSSAGATRRSTGR